MPLTPEQAKVKQESLRAQADIADLDQLSAAGLALLYNDAVRDIQQQLQASAGVSGAVTLGAMAYLLQQLRARLHVLSAARTALLEQGITQAADLGARPFAARVPAPVLQAARQGAVQHVRDFIAPDKLRLSDRLWRLDRHAEEILRQSVQNAVVRGDGAAQAAREFLGRGLTPPADITLAADAAKADQIGASIAEHLSTGRGTPLDNSLRVMRTEINRAHTKAYQSGAAADPDSIGTRFMLSPRHPRVDICDMHARANLFGLGPGVYPHGRSPLPAHPNTLSFEVVVYGDEVSATDKEGKQTVVEFLNTVAAKDRQHILGQNKNEAFEAGKLPASQVRSTWRAVKKRIERSGGA